MYYIDPLVDADKSINNFQGFLRFSQAIGKPHDLFLFSYEETTVMYSFLFKGALS